MTARTTFLSLLTVLGLSHAASAASVGYCPNLESLVSGNLTFNLVSNAKFTDAYVIELQGAKYLVCGWGDALIHAPLPAEYQNSTSVCKFKVGTRYRTSCKDVGSPAECELYCKNQPSK